MDSLVAQTHRTRTMATKWSSFSSPRVRNAHFRIDMMHFAAAIPLLAIKICARREVRSATAVRAGHDDEIQMR